MYVTHITSITCTVTLTFDIFSGEGGARPKISGQKSERGLDGTPPGE